MLGVFFVCMLELFFVCCVLVLWGENDINSMNFTHSGHLYLSTVQYQERSDRGMTWLIQVLLILKRNLHANKMLGVDENVVGSLQVYFAQF